MSNTCPFLGRNEDRLVIIIIFKQTGSDENSSGDNLLEAIVLQILVYK